MSLYAYMNLIIRLENSGVKLKALRLEEADAQVLEAQTGQRKFMFGYPVVVK